MRTITSMEKGIQPKWVEKSNKWYIKNPTVRALMQVLGTLTFGTAPALDTALDTKIQNIRERRLRAFFEELDKGSTKLTNQIIQSEDFLHAFFATTKAALNTRREEKIRMFARLLRRAISQGDFSHYDNEYEEHLGILDELSYREILILFMLERYENEHPVKGEENELQRASRFWNKFTQETKKTFHISDEEVTSILTRLNRTGCYETFVSGYFDYYGGKGKLTPTYYKLKKMIIEQYEEDV